MALVHHATLTPTKQELVAGWMPTRPWSGGRTIADKLAEYRFDDPDGEVGVETILFRCDDGSVVQVPLTYRGAPLVGGDDFLIGTSDHSYLGPRWVYDGCGDPVWAQTLATAILTGGTQAQMYFEEENGERVDVPPRLQVRGTGSDDSAVPSITAVESAADDGALTVVRTDAVELTVPRIVGTPVQGDETLVGQLPDGPTPLATLRRTT
jgi:hypothetical protein